jgi:hypothetical protein
MRGTIVWRATGGAAVAAACLALVACGGETTSSRTVTVTSTTPVTTPATTPAETTLATTAQATPPPPPSAPVDPVPPEDDAVLVDRPANFPNTGERFLLARLDRDIARRCTREASADRSRGSIAGLVCETQSVYGARSYYELFRNRVGMEASYGRYRQANGVPVARGQCVPAGGGGRVPGDAPWGFGPEAPSEGRVMCFRTNGRVWFITSVEKINVLAFATAQRFGAVDRFWRNVGLPSRTPVG